MKKALNFLSAFFIFKFLLDRVIKIFGGKVSSLSWLGTFHSISVKFLRRHAEAVGLKSNFTILRRIKIFNVCWNDKGFRNKHITC